MLILLFAFLLLPQVAYAKNLDVDKFSVVLDDQVFNFMQQPVQEENEELYLPMRSFLSIFGVQVAWDQEQGDTLILADDKEYLIKTNLTQLSMSTDGKSIKPIKLVKSQIYIPISLIKEIFNYEFSWDEINNSLSAQRIPETTTIFKNLSEVPEGPKYTVIKTLQGIASWYGDKFQGKKTTSGEPFDVNKLTAAHKTLPFGTYLKVTFLGTNKSTIVKVNDRGPHVKGRILDLSKAAAKEIGLKAHGLGEVKIEVLDNYDINA